LGEKLGKGLLQVWARQIEGGWSVGKGWPWNEDDENFEIRIIPEIALGATSDPLLDEQMPWMISIEEFQTHEDSAVNDHPCLMIHSKARIQNPVINSWRHFGSMFTPRYDNSTSQLGNFSFDFFSSFFSEYPVDDVPNPDSGSIPHACYLGGFGGGHGGQNEPYPLKMRDGRLARSLFTYRSEGDSYTAVIFCLYFAYGEKGVDFGFHHYRYS
jgi:hypothetical protein